MTNPIVTGAMPMVDEETRQIKFRNAETVAEKSGYQFHAAEETVQQAVRLSKVIGKDIFFYDDAAGGNGIENGFYDPDTGTIYINVNSQNPTAQIIGHELTHSTEIADVYESLSNLVMERIERTGGDLKQMRQETARLYEANGKKLDDAQVDQEIVAQYVEKHLLTDEQAIMEMADRNRSVVQVIKEWFDRFLAKLGNRKAQERAFITNARDIYAKALQQADSVRQDHSLEQDKQSAYAAGDEAYGDALFDHQWNQPGYVEGLLDKSSFAGPEAVGADLKALEVAKQMQAEGIGNETIRQKTGWYAGMDGKWRWEISGANMKYQRGGDAQFRAGISDTDRFSSDIDSWDGRSTKTFVVGSTSEPLRSIGIKDRKIIWHSGKIAKILQKHSGMDLEIIKQVPQIIEKPVIIVQSQNSPSRLAIFGEVTDRNGAPVTTILELMPTNKGGQVLNMNIIASAYGKTSNPAQFIENSGLVYLDPNKNRTKSWMQGLGLQLPSDTTAFGSIGSVTYHGDEVKVVSVPYRQYMYGENIDSQISKRYSIGELNQQEHNEIVQELFQEREDGILASAQNDRWIKNNSKTVDMILKKRGQLQTDAFREWFGASKVVTAAHEPAVVFHGTKSKFYEFNTDGKPMWFGIRPWYSMHYAQDQGPIARHLPGTAIYAGGEQKVIPDITNQILNHTFLIAASYIAEVYSEDIVSSKHLVVILSYSMEAKAFLDTHFAVIKDKSPGNSSKVVKHLLLGFQKALSIQAKASHNKDVTAVAKPATEDLDSLPLFLRINGGFPQVNLNGIAMIVLQRHIRLSRDILRFHFMDHTAHNGV